MLATVTLIISGNTKGRTQTPRTETSPPSVPLRYTKAYQILPQIYNGKRLNVNETRFFSLKSGKDFFKSPKHNVIKKNPIIYPPVGWSKTEIPPRNELKTGIPIHPANVYTDSILRVMDVPKQQRHIESANVCKVTGTVKGM